MNGFKNWFSKQQCNTWEPEEVNIERVKHSCLHISHTPQQNICVLYDRERYLELIIVNEVVMSENYRFIFAPDYFWTDAEEEKFDRLVQNENVAFSAYHVKSICEKFSMKYQDWHLKYYEGKPIRVLDHIHHCQMRNTAKEILYKAELDEIAARLSRIDEYNLIGSTPTAILDGLSNRTLRALNVPEGISLLGDYRKRTLLLDLQKRYSWIFTKEMSAAQCKYLDMLFHDEADAKVIAQKYKAEYERLSDLWADSQIKNYTEFIKQKSAVEQFVGKKIRVKEVGDWYEYQRYIRQSYVYLIQDRKIWDERIRESNELRQAKREYSDGKYTVFYPRTIEEFLNEARIQRNCLMEYLEAYVCNVTDILFLRKCESVNEPFVTLEIYSGEIVQAYTKCNKAPDIEVQNWLVEYARNVDVAVNEECFDEY